MTAMLAELDSIRSQLFGELRGYLATLAESSAKLPAVYPPALRKQGAGVFDQLRQRVQVVEDRSHYEQWLAEERERMRRAGFDEQRLAYAPRGGRDEFDEPDAMPRAPQPPKILEWDNTLGQRFPRAVVLGDPGFGKTWLLRYEARRLARTAIEQLDARTGSPEEVDLPIFVRLSDLNQSDDTIEETLLRRFARSRSDRFRAFLAHQIASDKCVFLFDAWDEVPVEKPTSGGPIAYAPHHRQRLGQRLQEFVERRPKARILLSSRIVGFSGFDIPDVQELELIPLDPQQIESYAQVFLGEKTDQFLRLLQTNLAVRGLARIPLMLSFLCRVMYEQNPHPEVEKAGQTFPTRKTDLYRECLWGLLRDWKEDDKSHQDILDSDIEAKLEFLGGVAYRLFEGGHEQFSERHLRTTIQAWQAEHPNHELASVANADLIREMRRDGLLVRAGEDRDSPYLFLHRTFHEYLAAGSLAWRERTHGWENIETIVDEKAWLPGWHEIVTLLAGQLERPLTMMKLLEDKRRDDRFRHRLALAGACLAELPPETVARVAGRLTTTIFDLCWEHNSQGTGPEVGHFNKVFPLLGVINALYREETPFLEMLLHRLQDSESLVRSAAAGALRGLGSAAATPEILDRLALLLQDQDWNVCSAAARALGGLGSAAATPEILDRLALLLQDQDLVVRYVAARALGGLGSAAATPEFLDRLALLLQDQDKNVRSAAAEALGGLGSAAATPEFLDRLALLLQDQDLVVRYVAARALGGLGSAAATPEILDRLALLLQDQDKNVRSAAAGALRGLGSAAATPEFLDRLAILLQDQEWGVRYAAAEALGGLGSAAATPEFLDRLALLLQDQDKSVRSAAASAVEDLGGSAATPEILDRLALLLQDQDKNVRSAAAGALRGLGSAAATPEILDRLAILLQDQEWGVRYAAAGALRGLGSAAATPEFLDRLALLLQDQDKSVRSAAARALGGLGSAAATPEILDRLALFLQSQDESVRSAAASAVKQLHEQGIRWLSDGTIKRVR